MFRKKLREMLHLMGVVDIDDDILDSLQKQLFQFLEFDDSLAGGITFKTGSVLTNHIYNIVSINTSFISNVTTIFSTTITNIFPLHFFIKSI